MPLSAEYSVPLPGEGRRHAGEPVGLPNRQMPLNYRETGSRALTTLGTARRVAAGRRQTVRESSGGCRVLSRPGFTASASTCSRHWYHSLGQQQWRASFWQCPGASTAVWRPTCCSKRDTK